MSEINFRHKYELKIEIGAHSIEDLNHALESIVFSMYEKEADNVIGPVNIVSGSPSHGYSVTGSIDPEWTKERHAKALAEWAENRKAKT